MQCWCDSCDLMQCLISCRSWPGVCGVPRGNCQISSAPAVGCSFLCYAFKHWHWKSGKVIQSFYWRFFLFVQSKVGLWKDYALVTAPWDWQFSYHQKLWSKESLLCLISKNLSLAWKTNLKKFPLRAEQHHSQKFHDSHRFSKADLKGYYWHPVFICKDHWS